MSSVATTAFLVSNYYSRGFEVMISFYYNKLYILRIISKARTLSYFVNVFPVYNTHIF